MTERPILYSAPMVRAKRAGIKTQTRRALRVQPTHAEPGFIEHGLARFLTWPGFIAAQLRACPYGQVGDRLWTREAFSYQHGQKIHDRGPIWYWADGNPTSGDWTKPKPSIHMPRWACRSVDELTEVRVERLQDISEADAIAEGGTSRRIGTGDVRTGLRDCWTIGESEAQTPVQAYELLWDAINGPGSWDANPWVWALTFRSV